MLNNIKEILQKIGDFFSMITTFVVDFFEDTAFFIKQLSASVSEVGSFVGQIFPAELVTAFLALIAIVVILRILGRD